MPQIQPPATRVAHHTAASMNATREIRRDILAAAKMPADAAGPTSTAMLHALTVRNATWTKPLEQTTHAVSHAARRVDAPMHRAPTGRLDYKPERAGLVDDSWKRFVNHLQEEGRVPGAMQGDPDAGVCKSTNVRPRAVTAFLRQAGSPVLFSLQKAAGASAAEFAMDSAMPPTSLQGKDASRRSSVSEDEGVELGSPEGTLKSSPAPVSAEVSVFDEVSEQVHCKVDDMADSSDDEGHGASRPTSPGSSDDETWASSETPATAASVPQTGARNVDIIRTGETEAALPRLLEPASETPTIAPEPIFSEGYLEDGEIPESWLYETEFVEVAGPESSSVDDWAPQPIHSARPVNDIRDWSFLDFSEAGAGTELQPIVKAPADLPRKQDVVEETAQTIFIGTPRTASERQQYLRQHDESLRRGNASLNTGALDGLRMIDGGYEKPSSRVSFAEQDLFAQTRPVENGNGDREEVRLAYIRAKPGAGTRSLLGADYRQDPSNSTTWFRSTALREVVRQLPSERSSAVSGLLRGILKPASPHVSTLPRPPQDMDTSDNNASGRQVYSRVDEPSTSSSQHDYPEIPEVDYSDDEADEAGVYF